MRGTAAALVAAVFAGLGLAAPLNIVHVVMDDGGYNDLPLFNKSRGLITPAIDSIAKDALVFSAWHVQPICSPTRSALMTGAYPLRLGTQANVIFWNTPYCPPSSAERPWIPSLLKEAGYGRTGMFGKSHLGAAWPSCLPTARGFDEFEGFLQGCGNYETHLAGQCTLPVPNSTSTSARADPPSNWTEYEGYDWYTQTEINITANGTYSEWIVAQRGVQFLNEIAEGRRAGDAEASKPFYLYLPFQNIHSPLEVQDRFRDMYPGLAHDPDMQTLSGMVSAFDEAVGSVFQALRDTGLDKETVFLLHSDNGAPTTADTVIGNHTQTRNWPLRGWKTQIWEGGTRVPALVWAPPGVLGDRAGTTWDGLVHVTDVAPTLVEGIAGGKMTGALPPDGVNQWDAFRGAPSARDEMLYNINPLCDSGQAGPPKAGVQQGGMKLLCECWDQAAMACTGEKWLFNLTSDMTESDNLAADMPAEVARLEARLVHYASDMTQPMQWTAPYMGDGYFCKDCPVGHQSEPYYAWRPFLKDPSPWPPLPKLPPGTPPQV